MIFSISCCEKSAPWCLKKTLSFVSLFYCTEWCNFEAPPTVSLLFLSLLLPLSSLGAAVVVNRFSLVRRSMGNLLILHYFPKFYEYIWTDLAHVTKIKTPKFRCRIKVIKSFSFSSQKASNDSILNRLKSHDNVFIQRRMSAEWKHVKCVFIISRE